MSPINITPTLNKMANSKIAEKYLFKMARENPAGFAARMALVSALTKDTVNCYYYTTQSWHNKKIPEEKRGFVGSLDLMNGILNVTTQLAIGLWLEKKAPIWSKKLVGKALSTNKTVEIAHKISERIKVNSKLNISPELIAEYVREKAVLGKNGTISKWLGVGFSAFVTLFGTQIVCKRMITPFLATPLAGWFSKRRESKMNLAKEKNTEPLNSSTPEPKTIANFGQFNKKV